MSELIALDKHAAEGMRTGQNIAILLSAVVLGGIHDLLFFERSAGVSYPLFVLAAYAVLYLNAGRLFLKKWCFGWFLVLPVAALSLTFLFFSNEVLRTINLSVIPLIFAAHVLLVTEKNHYHWARWKFLPEICLALFVSPIQYSIKPFILLFALLRGGGEPRRYSAAKKALTGVLLWLPAVAVVIMLLASADQVFGRLIGEVLENIDFGEIMQRVWLIGIAALIIFAYLWGLIYGRSTVAAPAPGTPKKLDEMLILPGLCLLNVIYGVFVWIQFSYLFGSIAKYLPEGLTYAEYARKGFAELIAVALINAVFVLGSLTFTQTSGPVSRKILQALNSILLACTFVMLISAHTRMSLYESAFGYTYLRLFTHAFMGMLLIMLGIALAKVWIERINLAQCYIVIGLISYVAINYVNVDVLIAQKNLQRYKETGEIDIAYLADMSYDTTPYLAALAGEQDQAVALAASEALAERRTVLSAQRPWQSYNLSERRARMFLRETAGE